MAVYHIRANPELGTPDFDCETSPFVLRSVMDSTVAEYNEDWTQYYTAGQSCFVLRANEPTYVQPTILIAANNQAEIKYMTALGTESVLTSLYSSYTHNNKTVYFFSDTPTVSFKEKTRNTNGVFPWSDSPSLNPPGPTIRPQFLWGPSSSAATLGPYAWAMIYGDRTLNTTDPYNKDPSGASSRGGGTGTFSRTGDDIGFPALPTLSAVDTGFITLFNPSASELKSLANYMWGSLFDISTWKKIFADPMDAILGLSIVPVAVPNGGSHTVTVGNISTGISMNTAARQYVEVDCGTLNVKEYWGAYLDYDPYTKAEIYLPYVGTHPLAVDDIMGKAVHVKYHVDILSGACCAYVKCGGSVLYSFVGQCSCSIPITGNDWTNVVNGALSIAASIGTMVATGGASAPMVAGSTIASTAVNTMKPTVEKSGSMGGMGGMLGVQTPYLILTRPNQAVPNRQNSFMGYPSFITENLATISGYTEIENIHLENIPATDQEISEIEMLLKNGVIF